MISLNDCLYFNKFIILIKMRKRSKCEKRVKSKNPNAYTSKSYIYFTQNNSTSKGQKIFSYLCQNPIRYYAFRISQTQHYYEKLKICYATHTV